MIRLENVTRGAIHDLSLEVATGQVCRLTVPSRDIKDELFALLAGHAPPEQGGPISNLKAWETILLPAWYHRKLGAAVAEPRVLALLREADPDIGDLRALMGKLPDRLTALERRLVALVRALLPEPELLVYDFLTSGLDAVAADRLLGLTQRLHGEKTGRVSVYLCPDDAASETIRADVARRVD